MKLLDLPLVLLQDILELIVITPPRHEPYNPPKAEILELRLVNTIFDREIAKYIGRYYLCGILTVKGHVSLRPFAVRLLLTHVGDQDRGDCEWASVIHASVDMLAERFQTCGVNKERSEILQDACEALLPAQVYRRLPNCRRDPSGDLHAEEKRAFKQCHVIELALEIATMKQYAGVFAGLVRSLKSCDCQCGLAEHLKFSIPHTIGHPDDEFLRILLEAHGTEPSYPISFMELELAIEAGHKRILDLVLDLVRDRVKEDAGTAYCFIRTAGECQRWDIIEKILNFPMSTSPIDFKRCPRWHALKCAVNLGLNCTVVEIMNNKYGTLNHKAVNVLDLFTAAIKSGHKGMVKLLLDAFGICEGQTGIPSRQGFAPISLDKRDFYCMTESTWYITRCVVKSGNLRLFKMLRKYIDLDSQQFLLLPYAVETGNMDFVQYAISKQAPQGESMPNRHLSFTEQLQYFSLFRAIVSGRCEFVPLLIRRLRLNPSIELRQGKSLGRWHESERHHDVWVFGNHKCRFRFPLIPIALAVDSGNIDMVRLLVDHMGAGPLSEEEWTKLGYPSDEHWTKNKHHPRVGRWRHLDMWAEQLDLCDLEFSRKHWRAPWSAVRAAYLAARGLPASDFRF